MWIYIVGDQTTYMQVWLFQQRKLPDGSEYDKQEIC